MLLPNILTGFEIVGTSAVVNADNYDYELGKKYAREDAIRKLWGVEAYMQQDALFLYRLEIKLGKPGKE